MKSMIIWSVITLVLLLVLANVAIYSCHTVIKDAGGIHNILVETGKELKQIKKEIEEE